MAEGAVLKCKDHCISIYAHALYMLYMLHTLVVYMLPSLLLSTVPTIFWRLTDVSSSIYIIQIQISEANRNLVPPSLTETITTKVYGAQFSSMGLEDVTFPGRYPSCQSPPPVLSTCVLQ